MKYSDYFMECLRDEGYTHCFYVAGGNSMHLLESASRFFECIPTVHEVTAAIAAEYFCSSGSAKAFALATAGPGLTNMITGIAGAWLESHELLVVGGQVKSENLMKNGIRQGGIQEIDGIAITKSISKVSLRIESPISAAEIKNTIRASWTGRKGPVFIEICLDVSATQIDTANFPNGIEFESRDIKHLDTELNEQLTKLENMIMESSRPLILLGNGISRSAAQELLNQLAVFNLPVATTWSGADRCGFDYPFYAGRPNTFGMRWANIFQQQADLLISIGSSLGLQQSGFNVAEFMPNGKVVQVDIDESELMKANPGNRLRIKMDSKDFAEVLPSLCKINIQDISEWTDFLLEVRKEIPTLESCQIGESNYLSPHQVINVVSKKVRAMNPVVICSSGGTFTAGMQCYENKTGQIMLSNKGLASMGYGLAGAIGVAFQHQNSKTLLFEGDGGFAQNLQDLGTVSANKLPVKIFITNNQGYASIRTSQKNYFDGNYLGCDTSTGLGFPEWQKISDSFGIKHCLLTKDNFDNDEFWSDMESSEPVIFEIVSDPEQMYLPKVTSYVKIDGSMESNPIHNMAPPLSVELAAKVFKYIEPPQ